MEAVLLFRMATSIAILSAFITSESAGAADQAQRRVNVRHFLLPGIQLRAQSLNQMKLSSDSQRGKVTRQPVVPPPPQLNLLKNTSESVRWPAVCNKPLKVGFFGDFWVTPRSPAVDKKSSLFDELRPILTWADFNVVNFEGSVTELTEKAYPKYPYALKQAPSMLKWLIDANIKHVTRANNHSMDFGWSGAQDTTRSLEKAGLSHAGVGKNLNEAMQPLFLDKDGIRVGVIAVTTTYPLEAWAKSQQPGVAHPHRPALRRAIEQAKKSADFVVVAFHWGEELAPTLRDHQKELARQTLSDGADIILGHHAHVAQVIDVESEKGAIVYGLGNFIFTSLSRSAKFGLGAHFEFCKSAEGYADGTTHFYRMVLTPLYTYNRVTGYKTRAMSLAEFLPLAEEYVEKGYFSRELEFYVPEQKSVRTLSEWLQLRQQASKEEQAVR